MTRYLNSAKFNPVIEELVTVSIRLTSDLDFAPQQAFHDLLRMSTCVCCFLFYVCMLGIVHVCIFSMFNRGTSNYGLSSGLRAKPKGLNC